MTGPQDDEPDIEVQTTVVVPEGEGEERSGLTLVLGDGYDMMYTRGVRQSGTIIDAEGTDMTQQQEPVIGRDEGHRTELDGNTPTDGGPRDIVERQ